MSDHKERFMLNERYSGHDGFSNFIEDLDACRPIDTDYYSVFHYVRQLIASSNSSISVGRDNQLDNIDGVNMLIERLKKFKSLLYQLKGMETGEKKLVTDYF